MAEHVECYAVYFVHVYGVEEPCGQVRKMRARATGSCKIEPPLGVVYSKTLYLEQLNGKVPRGPVDVYYWRKDIKKVCLLCSDLVEPLVLLFGTLVGSRRP